VLCTGMATTVQETASIWLAATVQAASIAEKERGVFLFGFVVKSHVSCNGGPSRAEEDLKHSSHGALECCIARAIERLSRALSPL
jgi:hypothetical protein